MKDIMYTEQLVIWLIVERVTYVDAVITMLVPGEGTRGGAVLVLVLKEGAKVTTPGYPPASFLE